MLIEANPYVPPVVLTAFSKMGTPVLFDRDISDVTSIDLEYDDAAISFGFVALNFTKSEKNLYLYMMEGLDRSWNSNGTGRFVNYSRLEPGSYVFRVKGSNNDGLWNAAGIAVSVNVRPPFWERWWFRMLGALTLAGAIVLLVTARDRRRRDLERLRLRIARDLHDEIGGNLTGIAVAGSLLRKSGPLSPDQDQKADDITKTAVQTTDLMRDLVWIINPQNDTFDDLYFRMKDAANSMLGGRRVTFHFPQDSARRQLKLDVKRSVYLIYKEMMNNIAKHSCATEVTVSFVMTAGSIVLTVADNGIGFDPSVGSQGMGLKNVAARAHSLSGTVRIESRPGSGTRIIVSAPIA
jgi:signal transduction histidine kinase